jgi:transcription-repair coupling factor (superfamily II helicase)
MLASSLESVLQSCSELAEPIRVSGVLGTAQAWALLRYSRHFQKSVVVLCPDDDSCQELAEDLGSLSSLVPNDSGLEPELLVFPSFEKGLYSAITPSIRTRLQRAGVLARLAANRGSAPARRPVMVLTTLQAAALRTVPREIWSHYSFQLTAGENCGSRELLIDRLLQAGYLRADTAEDAGTFSARGEIVDVCLPDSFEDHPSIRIELFDDIVERVRPFDPDSQRTGSQELSSVFISPCREVLINRETVGRVRERLKAHADETGIPRSVRDPVVEQTSSGLHPEFSESWSPFAYETSASLWDHLPSDAALLVVDELSCQQSFDQWREEERAGFDAIAGNPLDVRRIVPPPALLHDASAMQVQRILSRAKLVLSLMELADLSETPEAGQEPEPEAAASTRHRVVVKLNTDLASAASRSLDALEEKVLLWRRQNFRVLACAPTQGQAERLAHLLHERGLSIPCASSSLSSGFRWPAERLVILTELEILGETGRRRARAGRKATSTSSSDDWAGLQALSDLSPGDTIVHIDHGIGRYQGMVRLELSGAPADFLLLEYAGKDKLYLPVHRLTLIQKHGAADGSVHLDKLGSQQFQKTKEKVKESVRKLAIDLVRLYAERKIRTGFRFSGRDQALEEFEARFPYEETPDQAKAIDATLEDMRQGRIMDRLVCGDVGYGKTEVAIRAAYRAVLDGKQVAVLVPTTLLAHQHEQSFKSRMNGLPVTIESISRFKSAAKQKATLKALGDGRVDIIIGTHRLLSKDVSFKDLGLLIIDEEHRFGVEHKERLKALKLNVPVLTLTATPIPRTLHMSLSGLRDISLIRTPPVSRLPIRTFISKREDALVTKAIEFELSRGGQVFFLHNRVQSIHQTATRIHELVPRAKITVAHGQMEEGELEKAITEFYEKRSNVLVCTSIIESGIDLPSANTILIDRADAFGLAQLYQIRGRVGRGDQRGYAYLLVPPESVISSDAKKRLDVIQRFVELGSGFQVASHDLEIRGGGELLGPQQSGNIQAVGFDLYLELLEEAVQELRAEGAEQKEERSKDPEIKAPFPAFLSEDYVPDVHQRLSLYRKLSSCSDDHQVDALEEELRDRFGRLPEAAINLLWLIRTKVHLRRLGIDAITVGKEKLVLVPGEGSSLDPVRAIALVSAHPSRYQLTPDSRFVASRIVRSMKELYFSIQELLRDLSPTARGR